MDVPVCKHCEKKMSRMAMPIDAAYEVEYFYVCFNDNCSYYLEGWDWMLEKYNVKTSYRFFKNPKTEATGPLPVWSEDAMKDRVF